MLQWRNVSGAVHQQISVIVKPNALPRQRLGRRPLDLIPRFLTALRRNKELTAMARASNDAQFRLPRRKAAKMCAHRAQREIAFLRMNDVDTRVHIERN